MNLPPDIGSRPGRVDFSGSSGGSLHVVLAEDVPTNQLIARRLLQGLGCTVEVAADGQQAVSAVIKGGCDLVLMDVAMPGMDGLEATRRIRSLGGQYARLPIIGLTAYGAAAERQACIDAGMDQVLAKPIKSDALKTAIETALGAASEETGLPVQGASFDQGALEQLVEGLAADDIAEVLGRVLEDLGSHTDSALAGAASADAQALARGCHVLKGLAGSFGCAELAGVARDVERHCLDGDDAAAIALALERLGGASRAAVAAIQAFAHRGASPS